MIKRGPAPGSAKAKHGGLSVRAKYGRDFYMEIGKKGGEAVKAKRGWAFYQEIGKRGGCMTRERYGRDFYSRIGMAGGTALKTRRLRRGQEAKEEQKEEGRENVVSHYDNLIR